jgi:hypothetical protein
MKSLVVVMMAVNLWKALQALCSQPSAAIVPGSNLWETVRTTWRIARRRRLLEFRPRRSTEFPHLLQQQFTASLHIEIEVYAIGEPCCAIRRTKPRNKIHALAERRLRESLGDICAPKAQRKLRPNAKHSRGFASDVNARMWHRAHQTLALKQREYSCRGRETGSYCKVSIKRVMVRFRSLSERRISSILLIE